jgi:hypothetical protein
MQGDKDHCLSPKRASAARCLRDPGWGVRPLGGPPRDLDTLARTHLSDFGVTSHRLHCDALNASRCDLRAVTYGAPPRTELGFPRCGSGSYDGGCRPLFADGHGSAASDG